jgi:L-ascorbate metabolism protein UlaG (beta-lactamase superfamily)
MISLQTVAAVATLALLAACTTFGRISWRNALIVLRTPDSVQNRITTPERPGTRLAALWIGHSTVLVQLDDKFILTDPIFTRYIGGLSARLVVPGIAPENLPPVDAVLVSHRHFDHLSTGSFALIQRKIKVVLTPPGAAADVSRGAYPIVELPAWQVWQQDGLRITAVPVRHSGGRLMGDAGSHPKAFTGFVVEYHGIVVFFAGDTAYDEDIFRAIATRFPVMDLALMPIGPIKPEPDMLPNHLNPEQALTASHILGANHMLPIHFGTFINSFDERGDVEAAFSKALATRGADVVTEAPLWRIGEQRVYHITSGR